MKKSRMIASALIAASMLVGAGYAAWNKTLTINHSVTTGQDVAVEFVQGSQYISGYDENYNYLPVTYNANATTANYSIEGLRPGSQYTSQIDAQNIGPLPAKFDNAFVSISGTESVVNNMSVDVWFWVFDSNRILKQDLGHLVVPLADLQSGLNSYLSTLVLQPGDYISTFKGDQIDDYYTFMFSSNAGPETMNGNVQFSIQLNFKQ